MSGTAVAGAERIANAFRRDGRSAALMPYLMGGFPDLATSRRLGEALADAGADVIEVGVPFSDPLADGPVIQAAGERALAAGATFESVLEQVATPLTRRLPVVLMCYANPLMRRGFDRATAEIADCGVAGLIVPDLPAVEAGDLRAECDRAGLALVPLVAPTTPPDAVDEIARTARGFVYVVSVTGVTGERGELPPGLADVVARVRGAADTPVAVGFGIGSTDQVARVGEIADGVIVGSRLVRALSGPGGPEEGIDEAAAFVREAAAALSA